MAAVLSLSLSQSVTPFSLLHLFTPLALLFVRPPAFHLTLLLSRHRTALRTEVEREIPRAFIVPLIHHSHFFGASVVHGLI